LNLRLLTITMIHRTMDLSGGNRSNLQVQAALTAVTDVIKKSVWFIIVYCSDFQPLSCGDPFCNPI